jgi:hypothetical protein
MMGIRHDRERAPPWITMALVRRFGGKTPRLRWLT